MTEKRIPSIDHVKARGQRLSEGLPDEIDAVTAAKINSPSSSTRAAADGRYRTVLADIAPGCVDVTVGTGIDDSGDDPVSVTDEAVTALVLTEASSTRAALDSLYADDDILTDADLAGIVTATGSATHSALVTLINDEAGGVAGDADVADLIADEDSDTRAALDALYALPKELKSGPPPTGAVHSDAGVGATMIHGGTRIAFRTTVTTGSAPVQGGVLATWTLTGYTLAPLVLLNPRDQDSAAIRVFAQSSNTVIQLVAASEVGAFTAYTFDVLVIGF